MGCLGGISKETGMEALSIVTIQPLVALLFGILQLPDRHLPDPDRRHGPVAASLRRHHDDIGSACASSRS
jgi:hypothetical protein